MDQKTQNIKGNVETKTKSKKNNGDTSATTTLKMAALLTSTPLKIAPALSTSTPTKPTISKRQTYQKQRKNLRRKRQREKKKLEKQRENNEPLGDSISKTEKQQTTRRRKRARMSGATDENTSQTTGSANQKVETSSENFATTQVQGKHGKKQKVRRRTSNKKGNKPKEKKSKRERPLLDRIPKEVIKSLPFVEYKGPISVITNMASMTRAVEEIMATTSNDDNGKVHLGFDTESRPQFKKGGGQNPTALVQIATATKVYLFRVCQIGSIDPLIPLLESERFIKLGVSILADAKELKQSYPNEFTPRGFLDLTSITGQELDIPEASLTGLAARLLHKQVRKSKKIQLSNWAQKGALSPRQVSYAAIDAWVGRAIYMAAKEQLAKDV